MLDHGLLWVLMAVNLYAWWCHYRTCREWTALCDQYERTIKELLTLVAEDPGRDDYR